MDTGSITLVADADGETGSADGVSDWADAFITHQFRANNLDGTNDNVADGSATYIPNGLTTVDWAFHADHADAGTAGNEGIHFVHVLEHADVVVTRFADTGAGFGAQPVDITSAGLTDISSAGVEVSRSVSGTGRQYAQGWVMAEMTSTTNVNIATHRTTGTTDTRIQIIDFENVEAVSTSPIVGAAAGSSVAAGTLTGVGALVGSISTASSAVGALTGIGVLTGSAAGASTLTGALTTSSAMVGAATGSSTAVATLTGVGELVGTAAGSSVGAATASTDAYWASSVNVAFVGNSYTQNFESLPALIDYYLGEVLVGWSGTVGAPPHLATTIANSGTEGWFPGMSLAGMALYDDVDQSSGGSTDAIDAILTTSYDYVVLTSGFRQESRPGDAGVNDDAFVTREFLDGAGATSGEQYDVCLETVRRIATRLTAGGSTAPIVVRMTHEGFNANDDTDLDTVERTVRLQVLGARQLLREGVVDRVVPDHYVWSRLQWGVFGDVGSGVTSPVAAYASLTHTDSSQSGGSNLGWMNRSQGDTAPFLNNGHQNALAMIVQTWIWGYAMFGIDPRGDTTFDSATGLPSPFDDMISPSGANIYGGHNTGLGNTPYDTGTNPSGPPDSELDLDWNATVRGQIQDIIVAAVDDFYDEETEFDNMFAVGTAAGSSVATGTLTAAVADDMVGTAAGSSTLTATLTATGELNGALTTSSTTAATLTATGELDGTTAGASATTATLTATGALAGTAAGASALAATLHDAGVTSATAAGSSVVTGTLTATGALVGASAGATSLSAALTGIGALSGAAEGSSVASAVLGAFGVLAGASTGGSTANATLVAVGALSGQALGASTATGNLAAGPAGGMSATAAGSTLASGVLTGIGALVGTAAGSTTAVGSFTVVRFVSGSAAGTTLVTGDLSGDAAVVPVVGALSSTAGPPTGGQLVEITGSGFRTATIADVAGIVPVAAPTVEVLFGTLASPRVAVVSSSRLYAVVPRTLMPVVGRVTAGSFDVDITVSNIDENGDVLPMESVTAPDAYTYARPDVSTANASMLARLTRQLLQMLKSEVVPNVVLTVHSDYDSDTSTTVVDNAETPSVVLIGPALTKNTFFTDGATSDVELSTAGEFGKKRSPVYYDVEFDIVVIAQSTMQLMNLIHLITVVLARAATFHLVCPEPEGTLPLDLNVTEGVSVQPQTSQLNSNVRTASGTFSIVGLPFDAITGAVNDAMHEVAATLTEAPTLQPAEQFGENLPEHQGGAVRSPPPPNQD